MPHRITTAVLVLVLGVLAAPAQASDKRYFECPPDGGKLLNVRTGPSGWTSTAPTASSTSGAGCGYLTTGHNGDVTAAATAPANPMARFAGTYAGRFDALNVELWELGLSRAYNPWNQGADYVTYTLRVDGAVKATGGRWLAWTRPPADRTQRYVLDLRDLDVAEGTHQVALDISMGFDTHDASALVFGASEVPAHVEFVRAG